jgi:DNA-binding NarL/FixJ family response regulator
MPGMDGFETARRIRIEERSADNLQSKISNLKSKIPIIAISAGVSESTHQESLSAGCDDFLAKPVKIADLLECLQRHLTLEWVYAAATPPDAASQTSEPPAIPPSDVLHQLVRLADSGYVNDLEDLLAELAQNHAAYLPFVTKIRKLARDLHLQQIVEELKPYLQQHDLL